MPYYYCAEEFELTSASTTPFIPVEKLPAAVAAGEAPELMQPVQQLEEGIVCDPTIKLDRKEDKVKAFDFFPGSTDLVILALTSGVYIIEIDDRAWQNSQSLILGGGLDMRVEDGNIYVSDGTLIYQVILER